MPTFKMSAQTSYIKVVSSYITALLKRSEKMAGAVPQRLDIAPFTESNLHSLGRPKNWPELRRIIGPVVSNGFAVVDQWSQGLVDDARHRFDSCVSDDVHKRSALDQITISNVDGDGNMVEMLLSVGVDPDVHGADGWRPSHAFVAGGRVKAAKAILLCRPDMRANTNPRGYTPLGAALRTYVKDKDVPEGVAGREDVAAFIKTEKLEDSYKKLPELAVRKRWFAVKNLVRRQVVSASEFNKEAYGKTAVEWAEHFGENEIAKELRYYVSHVPLGSKELSTGTY